MRLFGFFTGLLLCALAVTPWLDAESAPRSIELNNAGVEAAKAGNFEQGVAFLREACQLAPNDELLSRNLSGMLTDWGRQLEQNGKLQQAIDAYGEAIEKQPDNSTALVQLGDLAYLVQGQFEQAVALWERAHPHLDQQDRQSVAQRISQAKRDALIERTYSSLPTEHFRIKYDPVHVEKASELSRVLEQAYERMTGVLHASLPPLAVILYAGQDFQRVSGQRDSTFGLYDGRIRVRLDEIGTAFAPQILHHELAHAFLATAYGPRLPIWVHEGFAQLQEPEMPLTSGQQAALDAIQSRTAWVPLKWLDRRFAQPSNQEDLERAYMQSRFVVDRLMRHGTASFQQFLESLKNGKPVDQAFDGSFSGLRWAKIDQGAWD